MKKIITFIIGFLILLNISNVYGCSCAGVNTPYDEYKYSDLVFIGTVVDQQNIIENINEGGSGSNILLRTDLQISTFKIQKIIKGLNQNYINIKTYTGPICPTSFYKGSEYIVYAYGKLDNLSTGFCSRTSEIIDAKEDIEAFKGIEDNKFNYFILMLKVYKNFVYGIGIGIFFLIYGYVIYRIRKYKKLKLIKNKGKK